MTSWQEDLERVQEALIALSNTPSKYSRREAALTALARLKERMEAMERALRDLLDLTFPGDLAEFNIYNERTRTILKRARAALTPEQGGKDKE